ncbi:MAG: glucose-1-phosphate adenylyltransferase [Thermodesulfobacteriota bacterium]|nr:glucose-1-phosphate adenylyltransferase [Thermodesulfobacteriota bacterium]
MIKGESAMKNMLAMVMAGGNGERLYPLTRDRGKPAVPFGGIYRLIDFTLSNCVNSGIRKIVVLTQYKSLSLERHLRLGWNILNQELDEYIFSIPPQKRISGDWYKGTADSIYQNLYFADMINPEYFLILSADHVYRMDYSRMLAFHKKRGADVTVATVEVDKKEAYNFGIMKINDENRITGFVEKPKKPADLPGDCNTCLANMGVYIFNSGVLRKFLEEDAHNKRSHHDFGKDIIPEMIHNAKVFACNFQDENKKGPEYWRDVGTIDAYFEGNMDLVNPYSGFNLHDMYWPIRTYHGQYPPAMILFAMEYPGYKFSICRDSIISGGCLIKGGNVINSVLSPMVHIDSGAEVTESVLMEGVKVGKYCKIKRAILDKGVTVLRGTEIGYDSEADKKRFFVTDSGIVVIPKGMEVASTDEEFIMEKKVVYNRRPARVIHWAEDGRAMAGNLV